MKENKAHVCEWNHLLQYFLESCTLKKRKHVQFKVCILAIRSSIFPEVHRFDS